MTKRLKKQFKQQKARDTEIIFEEFCQKNAFEYGKIDDPKNSSLKSKFLKEPSGKCADFWCKKEGKEIFVEIKTLTNLTNQKREESIDKAIDEIKAKGLPGGMTSEAFDPTVELEGPFTTFLKDASSKFKNLKDGLQQPRILFINGVFVNMRFTSQALFLGAYDSYKKEGGELVYAGLRKKKDGLFDKTGANVSAIIYWDKESDQFFVLSNPKAKIFFSEEEFKTFFGKTKI